jgi:hypothetical protein
MKATVVQANLEISRAETYVAEKYISEQLDIGQFASVKT